ncbi:unnamed protein product [Trichobilharzia szidati]|nr:unnamed protein product [Trichobilharzia szidati]
MTGVSLMNSWVEVNNDFKKTANTTQLMDDDPEIFDGSSLYSHFCNVWQNSQTSLSEIPIQYKDACYKTVQRLPKIFTKLSHRRGLPNIRSVTEMINLERNTWSLISSIYLDRFQSEMKTGTTESSDLSNFNHSEKEIIRLLYEKDSELRETQILIDWLELLVREQIEEVAERYECLFNQTTAWENTAHLLDYLPQSELTKRRLVKELHPDVVTLTGNELDQKDQIDNDRYVNYLFLCLRGGDLHRAQLLCTQRHEYWRAISLEGWRPFHYSGFIESESKEMEKAFNEDEELGDSGPFYMQLTVEGNPTRILYKSACWWNSENVNLRSFERAIYATLSGNLDVLTQILPASWTDQTWAHCRALVEARVDSSLRSLLNTGPRADTLAVTGRTTKRWPLDGGLTLPDSAWAPGDWTLSDAFARVDARLGWSAIGCLEKCSSSSSNLRMRTVIRSAMNDFLMDDNSYMYANDGDGFRNNNNNGDDLQSPSVYAIVYCIFYAVQQTVMLRNYDSFLATLANIMPKLVCYGLGDGVVPEIGPIQPPDFSRVGNIDQVICHTLRFLTHFVLFLKSAEADIQDVTCSEIIKAYLCFLMCSLTEVLNAGWNLSQKSFTECLKKTEHESFKELIDVLLNSDIREYGVPWLGDYKKSTQLEANGRIVQLTRLRNISIPQAVEDMMMTTSADNRGPCLLRLTFTDGRNTITGLDMQDKTDLSMDIPPGTKFRLMGSIPISMGFLLLSKNHLKVLGGTVTNLIREWNMTKFLKDTENRNITGGAPVFVPFGSREATDLIQSEGKFLSQLRSDRESNQMKFDSFQMATARNEPQEESELQAMFNEQRKEILAELKASNSSSSAAAGGGGRGGDKTVSNYHNANRTFPGSTTRRFKPGLSKFYQLQLQKSEEYSLAIGQLLSLGYPYQLASSALKINRGNYQAAVDYLLSKSTSTSMHLDENPVNNNHTPVISSSLPRGSRPYGGRGSRGGRGGRFNSTDGDEMNSSRFHSSSADTPQSRPSTGLVRLDDLIVDSMPTKSATAAVPPSSTTTKGVHQTVINHHRLKPTANQVLLSVGCPILAQNISGDYEEAQLIGYLSNTNTGSSSGEKIVLVAYLHSDNATGKISIEEEIVPISLIRTMNREKITIDMVPPAPSDRVKPYGSSSNSASMNSNQFDDIHFSHQPYPPTSGRGYRGNSRGSGGGGGRRVFSGGRGRRGSSRGGGGGRYSNF